MKNVRLYYKAPDGVMIELPNVETISINRYPQEVSAGLLKTWKGSLLTYEFILSEINCPWCNGKGKLRDINNMKNYRACNHCKGTGIKTKNGKSII